MRCADPYIFQSVFRFECVSHQVVEGGVFEGAFVGGFEDDFRSAAVGEGLSPPGGTQAPTVAGLETWKVKLGVGRDEVVALLDAVLQKLCGHDGTDGV